MKLQEITIDHEKLFFPVLGDRGQGKWKKKKEKITTKLLYQKEHESREVGEHWNRAERSHVYAVMQNPIESDPVGSLSSLLFFSLHCGQPDRRIKRPWKDDYIFD